jgi:hypothetical protein
MQYVGAMISRKGKQRRKGMGPDDYEMKLPIGWESTPFEASNIEECIKFDMRQIEESFERINGVLNITLTKRRETRLMRLKRILLGL